MKPVLCPKCGARSIVVAWKPFCAQCGWNLEAAKSAVHREVVSTWVVCIGAVGLLALLFMTTKGRDWAIVATWGFTTSIVLGYYFLSLRPNQKTLHAAKERFDSKTDENERNEQVSVGRGHPIDVSPDWIFCVSKPRAVRLRWQKAAARFANRAFWGGAALLIFSVFFLPTARGDFLRASIAFLAIGLIFLFFLGFQIWRGFRRHRLLQNGEVAIGLVLSQERSGEWKQSSKITFEFEDRMGRITSDTAMDLTESLYEGMPVVVFYQAENVKEHVLLCETFFGIAVEGESSVFDR